MINKTNFREVLLSLGFDYKKDIDVFYKYFENFECELRVDFKRNEIIYPESKGIVVNDKTTSNFEHPENFVVFECVHRLLEKGYRPNHIELEPRWKLGHELKSGKADICVYDEKRENILLIIECKTAGTELEDEKRKMLIDGGQLFSYWQQERSSKWLCLYTSNFQNGSVVYENFIVDCTDDENIKNIAKKDRDIKLYEKAKSVQDLFAVWEETYNKQYLTKGVIFGDESQAYQIGIPPLRKKHLSNFSPSEKIVNQFEEILRHNNVSDKENAFNRLIALFICKLVDEIQKDDDDIVEFQYKIGTDTYESLQDRLQRLHKEGMQKFMNEEIFYIPDDYAENLFTTKLNGKNRKAAIDDLKNTIKILKFYSNNDFAFKDVHNEQLFYQNGKVLVEVVQLFERYRIIYPNKNQFLGDLFEQLLNKGFKQNEGQFFTPTPITRFIWNSLPLNKVIQKKGGLVRPKILDYACGAGHFLTEAVEAINEFFERFSKNQHIQENQWVEHAIFGIEKDYRLARVAKVSLYMNGAGRGNIKFGDGLDQYKENDIKNGTFDILVANPPYAVSAFKPHLKLKDNFFTISDFISNEGSEIETLFVERIAQVLKPSGIAAVILPSSITSKSDLSYRAARKNLFENFKIHAIVQLGSKTFGATGTSTVVLFLEKYSEPPKIKDIISDNIGAIFNAQSSCEWGDDEILSNYLEHQKIPSGIYQNFITRKLNIKEIETCDYFSQYFSEFKDSREYVQLMNKKSFSSQSESDKNRQITELFCNYLKRIEEEKLFYFALTFKQSTLIISSPKDNSKQKNFLGYTWSNRKGFEGIQIKKEGGLLYNPQDRYDEESLAAAIRYAFDGRQIQLSEKYNGLYTYTQLKNLIDFESVSFSEKIKLSEDQNFELKSNYSLEALRGMISSLESGSRPTGGVDGITTGAYSLGGEHIDNESGFIKLTSPKYVPIDFFNEAKKQNKAVIKKGDLLICKDGARTGKVALVRCELDGRNAMVNEHVFIVRCKDIDYQKYLFYFFLTEIGQKVLKTSVTGSAQGGMNKTNLQNLKIPKISKKLCDKIVQECEKIDTINQTTRMSLEEYKAKLYEVFSSNKVILNEIEDEEA